MTNPRFSLYWPTFICLVAYGWLCGLSSAAYGEDAPPEPRWCVDLGPSLGSGTDSEGRSIGQASGLDLTLSRIVSRGDQWGMLPQVVIASLAATTDSRRENDGLETRVKETVFHQMYGVGLAFEYKPRVLVEGWVLRASARLGRTRSRLYVDRQVTDGDFSQTMHPVETGAFLGTRLVSMWPLGEANGPLLAGLGWEYTQVDVDAIATERINSALVQMAWRW